MKVIVTQYLMLSFDKSYWKHQLFIIDPHDTHWPSRISLWINMRICKETSKSSLWLMKKLKPLQTVESARCTKDDNQVRKSLQIEPPGNFSHNSNHCTIYYLVLHVSRRGTASKLGFAMYIATLTTWSSILTSLIFLSLYFKRKLTYYVYYPSKKFSIGHPITIHSIWKVGKTQEGDPKCLQVASLDKSFCSMFWIWKD